MKKNLLAAIFLVSVASAKAQTITDSVTMGGGYPNMVYYQLSSGSKTTVPFTSWDMGFITSLMSGAIISDPNTISVYVVPGKDSSYFTTLTDTTGLSTWQTLYNSDTSWYNGAFNQTTNLSNPFDFGWGVYDITSHNVYGNTLFVINKGGSFKKLLIKEKEGATGAYVIRIADIAGTNDQTITIDALSAATKNFIYFSTDNNSTADLEPPHTDWDILFTHYITDIPGLGPYPVTGVESNLDVTVAKASGVDVNTVSVTNYSNDFSANLSEIGYDWKVFDPGTFTYTLEDSLVYFVKDVSGKIYELRFTNFNLTTGTSTFNLSQEYGVGIHEVNSNFENAIVYPNPSKDEFNLIYSAKKLADATVSIVDLSGKQILATSFAAREGLNQQPIHLPHLSNGMYFVKLNSGSDALDLKLMIAQ